MISDELLKEIDRGREGLNQGTTTGLDKLDDLTGGNLPNNFIVILAQSGVGSVLHIKQIFLYLNFFLNAVPIKEFQELLQTKNGELSKKNPVVNIEIKKSISPQSVGIEPINIE